MGDQTRTIEGAYRLPGDGLYVPEDKVPQFQLLASRAETLDQQNRALYEQTQAWDRLTSWPTKDAQGNPTELKGAAGLQAAHTVLARSVATLNTLNAILSDPNGAMKLVEPVQTDQVDREGNPIYAWAWKADAMESLQTRAQLAAKNAEGRVLARFAQLSAAPPPPEPTIADVAAVTIQQITKDYQIDGLTAADETFLAGQLARYVQQTPQGRAIDPAFVDVVKDRAAMRAEQKRIATSSKTADTFNGGMNKGRQGAPQTPRPAAPSPAPAFSGRNAPKPRAEPSANDIWAGLVEEARTASA